MEGWSKGKWSIKGERGGRDNARSSRTGTISGSKRQTRRARVPSDHVSVTTAPVFRSYIVRPDLIASPQPTYQS